MTSMVPTKIVGMRFDPLLDTSAVLLGELGELTRVLPIMIGAAEAQAILLPMTDDVPLRPGTHDLTMTLMAVAGMRLEEVVVTELRDGVFFAELFVESPEGMVSVSARPSDAIALAVRAEAPIFVNAAVLEAAGVTIGHASSDGLSDDEIDEVVAEFHRALETASLSDFEIDPATRPPAREEPTSEDDVAPDDDAAPDDAAPDVASG
jgi:bifunctional DNase/RNase